MEITVDGRYATLLLPARFYLDHRARGLPSGILISESARYVRVKLDKEAMEDLWSDAENYARIENLDATLRGLKSSARATLRVLKEPMEEFRVSE